jgi:FKBP-type peptidyl-prolyl cis-trans isomerase FklB
MKKSWTAIVTPLLAAGMMLAGYAMAQQTPAATTSVSLSTPSSAASSEGSSQASSGQAASSQTSSPQTTSSQTSSTQASAPAKSQSGTAAKKAPATSATTVILKTERDKESYAMGMNIGTGLHRQGLTLDPALVARGLRDAQSGGKTAMTEDEARTAFRQLQSDFQQKMGAANRKEGEEFLAANKSKEGVVTLPSGLQYKILTQGNGPKPTAGDTVTVNYRGTLINGTEFDSSYKRGQPASFPVGKVIKGWTEALQLMPVGSKWELFIPADLAYGDSGNPGIPPGSALIFEVELLSIEQKK